MILHNAYSVLGNGTRLREQLPKPADASTDSAESSCTASKLAGVSCTAVPAGPAERSKSLLENGIHRSFPAPETPNFNWGRRRAIVWRQPKWLLPLVFCWSNPDVPRWDLGAVTSERCSAIVGLTKGSGLVALVNQHKGSLLMRSLTGEVKPISRDRWSDLCIRSHIVSVKSFRLQSGVVYSSTPN